MLQRKILFALMISIMRVEMGAREKSFIGCRRGSPRDRHDTVKKGSGSSILIYLVSSLLILSIVAGGVLMVLSFDETERENRNVTEDPFEETEPTQTTAVVEEGDEEGSEEKNQTTQESQNEKESTDVSKLNESEVESRIFQRVNEERQERGISEIELSEGLSEVARNHSRNMSESNYVGHVDPSGENVTRYREDCRDLSGFMNITYSENVAQTWYGEKVYPPEGDEAKLVESEEDVVENLVGSWMNSDWHRENLLNEKWRSTGVGVASNETGAVFVTQAFCTRG